MRMQQNNALLFVASFRAVMVGLGRQAPPLFLRSPHTFVERKQNKTTQHKARTASSERRCFAASIIHLFIHSLSIDSRFSILAALLHSDSSSLEPSDRQRSQSSLSSRTDRPSPSLEPSPLMHLRFYPFDRSSFNQNCSNCY